MDDLKLYAKNEKSLDSLIQTVRIFSTDIGMEFGIEKCATLFIKRGKTTHHQGIELPDGKTLKALKEGESYKYLGILEADKIKNTEMKSKVRTEYLRRVRKILQSKLNGGNLIKGINTWAVSLLRYSSAFLDWNVDELREMDRRTRKLLTMHGALHPKSNVCRIYMPRKDGGRGLLNVEETVNLEISGLNYYISNSNESLLTAAFRVLDLDDEEIESRDTIRRRNMLNRKVDLHNKQMHGQFFRQTEEFENNCDWIKDGTIKRTTESLIFAAQEQAIRTNYIKSKIDKTQEQGQCRMCGNADETINHVLSECPKLAQKEYKRRHDWVGKRVHWELARKHDFPVSEKWYEHIPEPVLENENYKILWDVTIQTDHEIEARRPDLVLVQKKEKNTKLVDFAVPFDSRVLMKENEKIEKYQDLAREIRKLWNTKVDIIPIVIGSLGTVSKRFQSWLGKLDLQVHTKDVQKTTLLNSARILRKVLEM